MLVCYFKVVHYALLVLEEHLSPAPIISGDYLVEHVQLVAMLRVPLHWVHSVVGLVELADSEAGAALSRSHGLLVVDVSSESREVVRKTLACALVDVYRLAALMAGSHVVVGSLRKLMELIVPHVAGLVLKVHSSSIDVSLQVLHCPWI